MKNNFYLKYPRLCTILIATFFLSKPLQAQQSLINVNGWNAYVHLPWDYSSNPSKTYPTIIFFPGIGEVGLDASLVIANGPGAYIKQGWNGNVKVGTDSVKFIVISLQPSATYPRENTMNTCIQTLKGMYRIDNSRLHLTGLSMGGWCTTTFVTGDAAAGPFTYASQVATVVEVEGMKPSDNAPYPNMFDNFAKSNGRLLGFEQVYDGRDILTRVNRMNSTKPNSGIFVSTNFGGGGHCCWEQFYGGSGVIPNKFTLDGISQNIYEWMARNPLPSGVIINQPPVAKAGGDILTTLPVNTATLNGSGTDADGIIASYAWTKVSGPSSGSVTSASSASTTVTNLVQGVYRFVLMVTDNSLASTNDTVLVTVNPAPNKAPVANAGGDIIITLPVNSITLNGSGTDTDGTIASYAWTKVSGPSSGSVTSASSASTTVTNLVQGVYRFVLNVTDNSLATANDTVLVTVNPAPNKAPVANAGSDVIITLPVNSITLNGSGTDTDGTIASYAWTKVSGPTSGSITSTNSASTTVTNLVQGVYKFVLMVTDNSLASTNDTVLVTVNPAPNKAPVANAGGDIIITLPVNSITLNGSGTDTDGTIASYAWTKVSGPSSGSVTSASSASTTVTNLVQGVYRFVLNVTDNSLATANDTVLVTVNPAPNKAPVANAGSDVIITLPVNSITLNGSGTDADGTIASYAWTKVSGPSSGSVTSASSASTTVTNLVQGVYRFVLMVTDNSLASTNDTVLVTVNPAPNKAPVANAGGDIIITLPVNSITLNGSGTDTDGTIASYAWTKVSGPSSGSVTSASSASTTVTNLVQGVYRFVLMVTDNSLASTNDTVLVTVNPAPNKAPVANAGGDIIITLPVNSITLNGSGTDTDGTIASYAWTKVSGPTLGSITSTNSASTTVANLVQGVYEFVLMVTDNSLATAIDTVTVTVNPAPNQAPVANAGSDVTITLPVNSVALNGSGTDADGTIASYSWAKVSGPSSGSVTSANLASTTVTNLVQGVYKFVLNVTDNSLATAIDTVTVTVNPAPNQAPVANAGSDVTITLPVNSVALNGSGTDADGTIASYAWTKVSGPTLGSITLINSASTVVNNLTQGVYKFVLNVTDNSLETANDTVLVTVNPAPNKAPVANAGSDVTITLPVNSVILNGSGTDADGTITSYAWTKVSGPSSGSVTSANLASTTVTNLVQGVYKFVLNVTDNSLATANDTVQVTVNAAINFMPLANAGNDTSITLPIKTYTLNGSGTDADGIIIAYAWSKISGPLSGTLTSPNTSSTGINRLAEGVYHFQLTVTDNSGATAIDTVQVIVNAANNRIPAANAGSDIAITLPENTITLNGNGSDADGIIVGYIWIKISGPSAGSIMLFDSASTTVTNLVEGVYNFALAVTDNLGATANDTVQVTVNATLNQAPVSKAGDDITITLPINTLILNGSGTDADGTILSYAWTNISGPSSGSIMSPNNSSTSVTNLVQGIYKFLLTVTDNSLATTNDTVQVTINAASNLMPVVNAGSDTSITLPVKTYTLSGSGVDADGNIAGYAWTKISGPSSGTLTTPNASSTGISRLAEGVYKFELSVTDNSGATAKDTIQVTVNPPINRTPIANAGADITITLPENSAPLDGNGADADGIIVSYKWKKISGRFSYLSNKNSAEATAYVSQGIYKFELTVTDNNGLQGKDTMQVTVNSKSTARIESNLSTHEIFDQNNAKNSAVNNLGIGIDHLTLLDNRMVFNLTSNKQQKINIVLIDVKGSTFFTDEIPVQSGVRNITKFIPTLNKGIFYIKFFTNKEMIVKAVVN